MPIPRPQKSLRRRWIIAGDWIPWSKGLTKRKEVRLIAAATAQDRRWVSSVMMELWEYADSETTDGFIPAVPDAAALTDIIPDTSAAFWTIVATIGWLSFRNGGVQIPNFDHWLGSSGKKRLKEARKKRKQRANVPILSPVLSPTERTTSPVLFSPPPEGKTSSGIEEGSGEKKGADCARDGPPTADGWPGYLAGEWLKHFTGTQVSERDPDKLKRFFGGLIAEGIQPTDIRDRIRDTAITALPDRRRPGRECTWDFAKRFGVKANGYQRPPRRESLRYDPARDG